MHGGADVEDLFNSNDSDSSSDGLLGVASGVLGGGGGDGSNNDNYVGFMGVGGVMQTDNHPSSPNDSVCSFTDAEVMMFPFVERVCHYMAGPLIGSLTHSMVEACIFVEVGTAIRDLDTMKVPQMKELFYNKCMSVVCSIPDDQFIDKSVQLNMLERYAGAKKLNTGRSLLHKYKANITEI